MRGQVWYVTVLVGVMCAVRFGLAAYGYALPDDLMTQLGMSPSLNPQASYLVRVWAIRDIVLAVLVLLAGPETIRALLYACIVVDATDVLSAHLSGLRGLFSAADVWALKATAIAALIPEVVALGLILVRKPSNKV
ncbi:MAG: hypothetical protein K2Y51_20985 [Gammaproteobacteria bacterium]|jgi:hypothetical protein|nr:hypothetical protein [Gammaproteobacteria bacterium]